MPCLVGQHDARRIAAVPIQVEVQRAHRQGLGQAYRRAAHDGRRHTRHEDRQCAVRQIAFRLRQGGSVHDAYGRRLRNDGRPLPVLARIHKVGNAGVVEQEQVEQPVFVAVGVELRRRKRRVLELRRRSGRTAAAKSHYREGIYAACQRHRLTRLLCLRLEQEVLIRNALYRHPISDGSLRRRPGQHAVGRVVRDVPGLIGMPEVERQLHRERAVADLGLPVVGGHRDQAYPLL